MLGFSSVTLYLTLECDNLHTMEVTMNILVYGAGVLGSLYAARLQEAGQSVTLLARGQRLQDIREHGIALVDVLSGQATTTHVMVVEKLEPEDRYDLAIVVMGKHQVASVLPRLAANKQIPSVLFLHNNAAGPQEMIEALGHQRVLLGFAGAGGKREGHVIDSLLIKRQPTTLGELDGRTTPRLEQIARAFIPTCVLRDASKMREVGHRTETFRIGF
jgi:2-dehydropantoate 2-reductase